MEESCISYYSYIKPQLRITAVSLLMVVYRTIPTSNHNSDQCRLLASQLYIVLFLHQTTTRHVVAYFLHSCISYYSYIKPQLCCASGAPILVVYRTIPTSNHNCGFLANFSIMLYIVLFLHQTTTGRNWGYRGKGCISYYSYIKPQLRKG